jgi:CheY-like chemotaxis protein
VTSDQTKFSVILIDDDPAEKILVERVFKALTDVPFRLDHVTRCSKAIALLEQRPYDLVLLDNRLSKRMSAKFSVPIIKSAIGSAPLAVISNDVSPDYLQDPVTLGIDHIVDKADLINFLKSQLDHLLRRSGLSTLEPKRAS